MTLTANQSSVALDVKPLQYHLRDQRRQRHLESESVLGVPACPVFYPSRDEFACPTTYIAKIRPEAEPHGMCKIVPPRDWQPPFSIDTTTFRFQTRIQRLNVVEGNTRVKKTFLEGLLRLHAQLGQAKTRLPSIAGVDVDLYNLKRIVDDAGGYRKSRQWRQIALDLGLCMDLPPLSLLLRNVYTKWLLPHDIFMTLNGLSDSPIDLEGLKSDFVSEKRGSPVAADCSNPIGDDDDTPMAKATNETKGVKRPRRSASQKILSFALSAPRKKRRDLNATVDDILWELMESNPVAKSVARPFDYHPGQNCERCMKQCSADRRGAFECAGCDLVFHRHCISPAFQQPVEGEWLCATCLKFGEDCSFIEGKEYSLAEFGTLADDFKRAWFDHDGQSSPSTMAEEAACEKEFWRIVSSPYETVEVEYGADLHSSKVGSGFPVPNRESKYGKCNWNLNNIATCNGSLLRYIDSDISGMMIPWLYVGMCFSTFCWHVEDHFTYSINYMHFGDSKTWYTIPSSDAQKFEDVMREEMPDLFRRQPDLLFHITTMLSPQKLMERGIKVSMTHQRSGEFVVTFPQAYHAGFNHGFNFAEAVNFALPDWLSFGLKSVQIYQRHCRPPVFSHDELLYKIATSSDAADSKEWFIPSLPFRLTRRLRPHLEEWLERETAARSKLLSQCPAVPITTAGIGPAEICSVCKSFLFSSWISFHGTLFCHEHARASPNIVMSGKLVERISLESIQALIAQCGTVDTHNLHWIKKLDAFPSLGKLAKLHRKFVDCVSSRN